MPVSHQTHARTLDSVARGPPHVHTSRDPNTFPAISASHLFITVSSRLPPAVSVPTFFPLLHAATQTHTHTQLNITDTAGRFGGFAAGSISSSRRQRKTTLICMCEMGFCAFIPTYLSSHREALCVCVCLCLNAVWMREGKKRKEKPSHLGRHAQSLKYFRGHFCEREPCDWPRSAQEDVLTNWQQNKRCGRVLQGFKASWRRTRIASPRSSCTGPPTSPQSSRKWPRPPPRKCTPKRPW